LIEAPRKGSWAVAKKAKKRKVKRKVAGTWHTFRPMGWEMALLKHELGTQGATEGDEEAAHVRKQLQMLVEEEIKPPEGKRVYVRVQYCIRK
jgi:hypothetical protein